MSHALVLVIVIVFSIIIGFILISFNKFKLALAGFGFFIFAVFAILFAGTNPRDFEKQLTSLPTSQYNSPAFYTNMKNGQVRQENWQFGTTFFSYVADGRGYSGILLPRRVGVHKLIQSLGENYLSKSQVSCEGTGCHVLEVYHGSLTAGPSKILSPSDKFIVSGKSIYNIVILNPNGVKLKSPGASH
jgi:hypothetical protein